MPITQGTSSLDINKVGPSTGLSSKSMSSCKPKRNKKGNEAMNKVSGPMLGLPPISSQACNMSKAHEGGPVEILIDKPQIAQL